MGAVNDFNMVQRLHNGEVGAFDELYWKYHQAIYKNILKFTKDQEAAQDLLQDVFIALWEKRNTIDAGQSVGGWLFVVSFNLSVNYTKKKLKEIVFKETLSATNEDSPEDFNTEDFQYKLLEQALQQLSPQKRKVFMLCKLEGKTYEQTAEEMHISKHTVKEYLSAAMVAVKEFIKSSTDYSDIAILACFFITLR